MLHGPGWVNSPSMNVSTSRPCRSSPEPTTRGAAAKPTSPRWRSSAWTAGVHGPASRITRLPWRWTTDRPPPCRTTRSSGEVTVHCRPARRLRVRCLRRRRGAGAWSVLVAGGGVNLERPAGRVGGEPAGQPVGREQPIPVDCVPLSGMPDDQGERPGSRPGVPPLPWPPLPWPPLPWPTLPWPTLPSPTRGRS
jgi:hypothetical protein